MSSAVFSARALMLGGVAVLIERLSMRREVALYCELNAPLMSRRMLVGGVVGDDGSPKPRFEPRPLGKSDMHSSCNRIKPGSGIGAITFPTPQNPDPPRCRRPVSLSSGAGCGLLYQTGPSGPGQLLKSA